MLSSLKGSSGCIFPDRSLLAGWFCEAPANLYETVEYGTIPKPVQPGAVGVPSTYDYATGIVTGSPDQILTDLAQQAQQRTAEANAAAYDAAIASGAYTPAGKLPFSASQLDAFSQKYGVWILLGLLGVGAFVLFKR